MSGSAFANFLIFSVLIPIQVVYAQFKANCTESSCSYCSLNDPYNEQDPKPYCRRCSNGLVINYADINGVSAALDKGGIPTTGHCVKGLQVENCFRSEPTDATKCEICRRGFYLSID